MRFLFVYEIGDSPKCQDTKDFADVETAKDHARESLEETLKASSAESASLAIGAIEGADENDVQWLGAYDLERESEPVWSPDG